MKHCVCMLHTAMLVTLHTQLQKVAAHFSLTYTPTPAFKSQRTRQRTHQCRTQPRSSHHVNPQEVAAHFSLTYKPTPAYNNHRTRQRTHQCRTQPRSSHHVSPRGGAAHLDGHYTTRQTRGLKTRCAHPACAHTHMHTDIRITQGKNANV